MRSPSKRFIIYLVVGLSGFLLDQTLKWWTVSHYNFLTYNQSFFLGLKNINFFWSIVLYLFLVIFLFIIEKPSRHPWSITFIFAGILSNLADRVVRGGIIDYLSYGNKLNFNLADIFLILGFIIYALEIWSKKIYKSKISWNSQQ